MANQVVNEEKLREEFKVCQQSLKSDFNDCTEYYRKHMVHIAYAVIASIWAVFGNEIRSDRIDPYVKVSIVASLFTLLIRFAYGVTYAWMLEHRFKEIEVDFYGSQKEFSERNNRTSEYPYGKDYRNIGLIFDAVASLTLLCALVSLGCAIW